MLGLIQITKWLWTTIDKVQCKYKFGLLLHVAIIFVLGAVEDVIFKLNISNKTLRNEYKYITATFLPEARRAWHDSSTNTNMFHFLSILILVLSTAWHIKDNSMRCDRESGLASWIKRLSLKTISFQTGGLVVTLKFMLNFVRVVEDTFLLCIYQRQSSVKTEE